MTLLSTTYSIQTLLEIIMYHRCGYCLTELRCVRTIKKGVCSKCENSWKRRRTYSQINRGIQNKPITPLMPTDLFTDSSLTKPTPTNPLEDVRKNMSRKRLRYSSKLASTEPCQVCFKEDYFLRDGKCLTCNFKESL